VEGSLCIHGPPFYLCWRNFILLNKSFFSSIGLLELVARMETAQVQAATDDVAVTAEVSNKIEQVIQSSVNPQFAQVLTLLNLMLVSQHNLSSITMRDMEERIVNKVVRALTIQRVGCQVPAVAEVLVASCVGDRGPAFHLDSFLPAAHNNGLPPQDTNEKLTKKGKLRKKAPKINVLDCLLPGTFTWSRQLRKA
jgi:hypothetical protein